MIELLTRLFRPDPLEARRRAMRQRREEPRDEFERRRANLLREQMKEVEKIKTDPMCVLNVNCARFQGQKGEA